MEQKTNYLALIVCPLINMALGMGWYGVFSQAWMDGHGLTMDRINSNQSPMLYVVSVVGSLISAYVLHLIFQRLGVRGWLDGLKSGAAIGLFGLVGTIVSYSFSLLPLSAAFIDGGFAFVLFCLYGALLGGWQKKG
ncbi:MAG: DUF1761 family protein [Bacteroidetes bacterium]|nr:DUF1761 family protein [Bacteroidota bacterium]